MTSILELRSNKEAALKAKAQAQGVSAEQYAEKVLYRDLEETANVAVTTPPRHISEVIRERMSKIPPEPGETSPQMAPNKRVKAVFPTPSTGSL